MDRRNFFGIIAAPLMRRVGPPPPIDCRPPMTVSRVREAIQQVAPHAIYGKSVTLNAGAILNDDLAVFSRIAEQMAQREREFQDILVRQLYGENV